MASSLFRSLKQALPVLTRGASSQLAPVYVRSHTVSALRLSPVSIRSFGENNGRSYDRREPFERREREPSPPSKGLFIGNLSFEVQESDLTNLIQSSSPVSIRLPTDYQNRPKGFAFVEFSSVEAATAAKAEIEGASLFGREMRADYSVERRDASAPRSSAPSKTLFLGGTQDLSGERIAEWLESFAEGSAVAVRTNANKEGVSFAFAEFESVQQAAAVKEQIEGVALDGITFTKLDFETPRERPSRPRFNNDRHNDRHNDRRSSYGMGQREDRGGQREWGNREGNYRSRGPRRD